MHNKPLLIITLTLSLSIAIISCIDQVDISQHRFPTELSEIPADPNNPITYDKMMYGDTLFHSNMLSLTGMASCASCHFGEHGQSPDPHFIGGIGEGATLTETPHGMRYMLWDNYEGNVDSMTWVMSQSLVNACFQEVSGVSGRFGGSDDPQLRADKIAHFNIKLSPAMIDKLMSCHATLFQAVVALDGHNQFSIKRVIKNEKFKAAMLRIFGTEITQDTPEEEIIFMVACCLDVFQRVEGLRNDTKFQRATRGEVDLSVMETAGYILFKSHCNTAVVNGIEYGCHTNKDLSGLIAPSMFPDLPGHPDCANNITGYPDWIRDTTQVYRKVRTIFPGSVAYGPQAQHKTLRSYTEDKIKWLGIDLSDNEVDFLMAYFDTL